MSVIKYDSDVTSALVSFPPGLVSLYHKSYPLSTAAITDVKSPRGGAMMDGHIQ